MISPSSTIRLDGKGRLHLPRMLHRPIGKGVASFVRTNLSSISGYSRSKKRLSVGLPACSHDSKPRRKPSRAELLRRCTEFRPHSPRSKRRHRRSFHPASTQKSADRDSGARPRTSAASADGGLPWVIQIGGKSTKARTSPITIRRRHEPGRQKFVAEYESATAKAEHSALDTDALNSGPTLQNARQDR